MPVAETSLYGDVLLIPKPAQAPMREVLEWKTDVIPARRGGEERHCLRPAPRQSFAYNLPIQPRDAPAVFNLVYGNLAGQWAIPIWSEAQFIGAVPSGTTTIVCDAEFRDFRADSLGLLWNGVGGYEVLELSAVSPTDLTVSATVNTVSAAWVLPLRVGRLSTPVEKSSSGTDPEWTFRFEVADNIDLAPSAPTQFHGNDIYHDEVLIISGDRLDTEVQAEIELSDDGLGAVSQFNVWTYNRTRRSQGIICTTPEAVYAYRQWLHRRKGRFRSFWQPSFENDIQLLSTGALTTTLSVSEDDRLLGATARQYVAIQVANGTWYDRHIDSVAHPSSLVLTLTLDSSLGGILASTVRRICYLGLKRLDADRVELNWPGNGVCVSSVPIVELTP